jgi:hypothetical protein
MIDLVWQLWNVEEIADEMVSALIILLFLVVAPLIYVSEGLPLTANLWLKLFAFAIGGPIVVYAIGWTIGWIFRGFRGR